MDELDRGLDRPRNWVRRQMQQFAKGLNSATGGALHPNQVTIAGVLLHLPIMLLIVMQHWVAAGVLLAIFGLMDTLDGELARLQKRASDAGMLLDATADRIKEIFVYLALIPVLDERYGILAAVVATAALGGSFLVSYVKAKGETAVAAAHPYLKSSQVNRLFQAGLARFEIRMLVLVVGLITSFIYPAVIFNAVIAWGTALYRLASVSQLLNTKYDKG